jgi:membrane-bound serine protease (ClpP class)
MFSILGQAAADTGNMAGWGSSPLLAVFLVIIGFVFVVAEIFTVSFGLFTLCALGALIGGIIVGFNAGPAWGVTLTVLVVVFVPVLVVTLLKTMPNTRWGRRLIPESPKLADVSGTGVAQNLHLLIGREGRTLTMCRPAGTAEFGGERCDVVSEGLVIGPDRPVKVIGVQGNRIVVRELP